jgi:hypothetical protein
MFACPLSKDSGRVRSEGTIIEERAACREWPAKFADDVTKFRPDVVLFVYGGPPPQERELEGGWHTPCSDTYRRWFAGQVGEALDLLSSTGATVFVAPSAYVRFPFMEWAPLDERTDCMNQVYRDVVAAKPRARIVPLDTFVCPRDRQCIPRIDGVELREDGVHYDNAGGDLVARWVLSQMLLP